MDFTIGGVAVGLLIFGIVEAAKEFGLQGKAARVMVLVLGVIFVAIVAADQEGLVSEQAMMWIKIVSTAVAGGLSAMGYYDWTKRVRNGTE